MKTEPLRTRFLRFVKIRQEDDCWEWLGARDKGDYGIFRAQGKNCRAHVVSYLIFNLNVFDMLSDIRKELDGPMMLHKCDRPWCVNPDHLYPGTAQQNVNDRVERGHNSTGKKAREALKESRPGSVKLTESQVIDIRLRASRGERTSVLSREYGTSYGNIHKIVTRRRWKDI